MFGTNTRNPCRADRVQPYIRVQSGTQLIQRNPRITNQYVLCKNL